MNLRALPAMHHPHLRTKFGEDTAPPAPTYHLRKSERPKPYRETPDFLLREWPMLLKRQAS